MFDVFPVSGRHIGILAGAGLVMSAPTRSPAIFRKSHRSISVKSQWFLNGSKKNGLGVFFYPQVIL